MSEKSPLTSLSEKLIDYFETFQDLVKLASVRQLITNEVRSKLIKELKLLVNVFDTIQKTGDSQNIQYVKQLTNNLSKINEVIKEISSNTRYSNVLQQPISRLDKAFSDFEEIAKEIIISSSVRVTRGGTIEEKIYELNTRDSNVVIAQTQGEVKFYIRDKRITRKIEDLKIGQIMDIVNSIIKYLSLGNNENKENSNSEKDLPSYLLEHDILSNNDVNILMTFFDEIFAFLQEKKVVDRQ
ncbi:MAG: hypothetical protein ACP6IS_10050 [Candidatus Asgardarchaeia archaeon]